jgi:hypothetical protein
VIGSFAAALAALLFALVLGRLLVRALADDALLVALGRPAEAAFGLLAGIVALSVLLGLAYAAGAPAPGALTALAGLLLGAACVWRGLGRPRAVASAEPPARGAARAALIAGWLLLGLAVLTVVVLSCRSAAGFPDAYQVWLLRGRVLFLDRGFSGSFFHDALHTAHDNRAYPPLLSLATAGLYEAMGQVDDRAAKLLPGACCAALLLLAHGALRRSLPRGAALLATLGLCGCTTLVMVTVWGIADLPLAAFVLAGGVVLLAVDDRRCAPLLALPLLGAVLTKNEGLPAAIALLGGFALRLLGAAGEPPGSRVRRLLLAALPAALAAGAWLGFAVARGLPLVFTLPGSQAVRDVGRLTRTRSVLASIGERLLDASWLPGWIAFALVLVLVVARSRSDAAGRRVLAAGAVVALLLLAYIWVLGGYEGDLPLLLRLSMGRLMLHGYPLALVVAANGLAVLAARPPRA